MFDKVKQSCKWTLFNLNIKIDKKLWEEYKPVISNRKVSENKINAPQNKC